MSDECERIDKEISDFKEELQDTSSPVEKARITAKISELKDRKRDLNCP